MSEEEAGHESPVVVWGLRLGSLAAILIAWQLIGSRVNPAFLSTPVAVASSLIALAAIPSGPYSLFWATVQTLEATFVGFVAAIVVGLPLGIVMGMYRRVDTMVGPFVNALYVTPRVALIPLFIVWFGISLPAIIATSMILAVFPIIMNTYAGVRDISKTLLETADVFQIKGLRRFRLIIFPSILPFFMTGVKLAIGLSLTGAVIAQILSALTGMGYMLLAFANYFETANVLAVVVVLMFVGVGLTLGVQTLEDKMAYWKETLRGYK